MKLISIVVPIYNEEGNIKELYRRLLNTLSKDFSSFDYEMIFVDDGSSDKSYELLRDLHIQDNRVQVVKFSRNFGHHIAISAGLDHARGDYVVMMDGDLQDQPEEIVKLYNKILDGCDVAFGHRKNKKFSFFKRFCSNFFVLVVKFLINEDIVINTNIFRMMTKKVVDAVTSLREHNRYVIGLIGWVGFKHEHVIVDHGKRVYGETKYNLRKQLNLALNAVFAFSDYPLKIMVRVGFMLVCFSFMLATYIFAAKFYYGASILGWSSLICSIFFIGGSQIFFLGILGEYIGRSYLEVKKRPLYVIDKFLYKKEYSLESGNGYEDRRELL